MAVTAFDLLKKASEMLLDPSKKAKVDESVRDAKCLVLKRLSLPVDLDSTDPQLTNLPGLPFQDRWKEALKEVLIDTELTKRRALKTVLANERTERAKEDALAAASKRRLDHNKVWEGTYLNSQQLC